MNDKQLKLYQEAIDDQLANIAKSLEEAISYVEEVICPRCQNEMFRDKHYHKCGKCTFAIKNSIR